MDAVQVRQALGSLPQSEKTAAIAVAAAELPKEEQRKVAQGLDEGVWPQDSMHRMLTIIVTVALALGACAIAVWASIVDADEVSAALVAVATAIVGGIFGFAQASR